MTWEVMIPHSFGSGLIRSCRLMLIIHTLDTILSILLYHSTCGLSCVDKRELILIINMRALTSMSPVTSPGPRVYRVQPLLLHSFIISRSLMIMGGSTSNLVVATLPGYPREQNGPRACPTLLQSKIRNKPNCELLTSGRVAPLPHPRIFSWPDHTLRPSSPGSREARDESVVQA